MNLSFDISFVDNIVIYALKGKITTDIDFEELEKVVFENISKNHFRVVFDLEELTHTNSSGIGLFMKTLTKTRIMNGDLVLMHIKGNVEKIFNISKLNEIYTICENQMEAINYFKSKK